MKKRYWYSLLFAIPGFFVAVIIFFFLVGALAGFLWLFVFGDEVWPSSVETILAILSFFTFFVIWGALIARGFFVGLRLESDPVMNMNHVMLAIALTIAPIAIILLHQMSVGNIGPKPDSILCSEFCTAKGYYASGMPAQNSGERICSCYSDSGGESLELPIDKIVSGQ